MLFVVVCRCRVLYVVLLLLLCVVACCGSVFVPVVCLLMLVFAVGEGCFWLMFVVRCN